MITFEAKELAKPKNMGIKAELAWRYYDFNNGGWVAAEIADCGVVVTDEAASFDVGSWVFKTVGEFVEWLEGIADENLQCDPYGFLLACGMVNDMVASDGVIEAIVAAIEAECENEKERSAQN